MKARDLAALAALGIAGKYAFDKFGNKKKDDEPKSKGKLGEAQSANDGDAGESEARMSKRDMNEGSGRRDAGGNTEKLSRQELDVPDRMSRQERDVPDRLVGKDAAGSRFTDKAAAQSGDGGAAARSLLKNKSSGAVVTKAAKATAAPAAAAPAAAAQPAGYEGVVSAAELGSQSFNSNLPAAQSGSTYSDVVPKGDLGSQDFRSNAKRLYDLNEASGAANPASVLTDAYGNLSRAEKHVDVTKKAANAAPLIAKSSALANVSHATQAAAMARKRAAELQAKMNNIARLDELNKSNFVGGRRAKGGAVKMASGGMASSKMSKPSGASRGDGIAQRGRTRGTLR